MVVDAVYRELVSRGKEGNNRETAGFLELLGSTPAQEMPLNPTVLRGLAAHKNREFGKPQQPFAHEAIREVDRAKAISGSRYAHYTQHLDFWNERRTAVQIASSVD